MQERAKRAAAAAALLTAWTTAAAAAATITVDTLNDDLAVDGFCSLREAILSVNDDVATNECPAGESGGDVVELSVAGTIILTSAPVAFFQSVEVRGPGAADLTIDGADLYQPLIFGNRFGDGPQTHRISGLTLRHGLSDSGGGLSIGYAQDVTVEDVVIRQNEATGIGGGVFIGYSAADGGSTVRFERVTIAQNHSGTGGGAIAIQSGGGTVTIRDSAIVLNTSASHGGGLYERANQVVTIERSTLSGNDAADDGGAVYNAQGTLTVIDSTITANTADVDGDEFGDGGGIHETSATTTVGNSIVAGNVDGSTTIVRPDVVGSISTLGYNLIGDHTGAEASFPVGQPNLELDTVGTAIAPIDPELGTLGDNGGPTPTHLPLGPDWPVIDQGSCAGALRDQRGWGELPSYDRIVDDAGAVDAADGCDVGAVEAGAVEIAFGVLFLNDFELGDADAWSAVVTP